MLKTVVTMLINYEKYLNIARSILSRTLTVNIYLERIIKYPY